MDIVLGSLVERWRRQLEKGIIHILDDGFGQVRGYDGYRGPGLRGRGWKECIPQTCSVGQATAATTDA